MDMSGVGTAAPPAYPDDLKESYDVSSHFRGWIVQMLEDEDPIKRDEAYAVLLLARTLLMPTVLWPYVAGALLRQVDARESMECGEHDGDVVEREARLVRLLPAPSVGLLPPAAHANWTDRLLAVVENERTPSAIKVGLIELAVTDIGTASDGEKLVKFLVERVIAKRATDDKTRACAILTLGHLPKNAGEGTAPVTDAKALVMDLYGLSGRLSFGPLARMALAYIALRLLVDDAPDVAREDAAYALAHESVLHSAWQAFNGGDSLREIRGRSMVSVEELVSGEVSWSWVWDQLAEINLPVSDIQHRKSVVWLGRDARPFAESKQAIRHMVSCIADQLIQITAAAALADDDTTLMLIRHLLELMLPAYLAEGTVVQELEASDSAHCALPVLRRFAREPEFDGLWHWIAKQKTNDWDRTRLLTTRADLQAFLSAPLPSHWSTSDNWIPDLAGLDEDEGWRSTTDHNGCCEAIRQLAARFEVQPDHVTFPLYRLQLLGQKEAASTAVKWIVHLLKYKRVIERVYLLDRFLVRALVGYGDTYKATGIDRRVLQPNNLYDAIGEYLDSFLKLAEDRSEDEAVRMHALNLIAMYPEKWRTAAPRVESLLRDTTESADVRAAALSTLSSLVPTRAASDQETRQEEEEQVRRVSALLCYFMPLPPGQVVTLRDAAAAVVGQRSDQITAGSPLPEELRSLVAHKALSPSVTRRLQWTGAMGLCKLLLRVSGIVAPDNVLQDKLKESPHVSHDIELELAAWLPSAKSVLCDTIVNAPFWATTEATMEKAYLLEFFGEAALDDLQASLLAMLMDESQTPERAIDVATALIALSFTDTSNPAWRTMPGMTWGVRQVPLNEARTEILHAFVRCEPLWRACEGATTCLMRRLNGRLQTMVGSNREQLALALGQ